MNSCVPVSFRVPVSVHRRAKTAIAQSVDEERRDRSIEQ